MTTTLRGTTEPTEGDVRWLLLFSANGTIYRYVTDQTVQMIADPRLGATLYTWNPIGGIGIEAGALTGSDEDEDHRIAMPRVAPFDSDSLVAVDDILVQMAYEEGGQSFKYFTGTVKEVVESPRGQSDIVEVVVAGLKHRIADVRLGLQANETCIWGFGDDGCKFDVDAVKTSATLKLLDGHRVRISGGSVIQSDRYYHRGFLTRSGLSIDIYSDEGQGPTSADRDLILDFPPPISWESEIVQVTPGCDKFLRTCRGTWGNEGRFMGTGIGMPDNLPTLERGDDA